MGFDDNFIRQDPEVEQMKDQEYQQELLQFGVPANNVVGGVMQSINGNLRIDLNQGQILYNDGVVDLLNVGGQNNAITISNDQSSSILTSITTPVSNS